MSDYLVKQIKAQDLTRQDARDIVSLMQLVWPETGDMDDLVDYYLNQTRTRNGRTIFILRDKKDHLVAHADVFRREMLSDGWRFEVSCLASVCVKPSVQSHGLGKKLVQAVFDLTRSEDYPVFLFQTQVPGFYQRLGSRRVCNRFFNGLNPGPPQYPWDDEFVMIFPGEYDWPEGAIDINGDAY